MFPSVHAYHSFLVGRIRLVWLPGWAILDKRKEQRFIIFLLSPFPHASFGLSMFGLCKNQTALPGKPNLLWCIVEARKELTQFTICFITQDSQIKKIHKISQPIFFFHFIFCVIDYKERKRTFFSVQNSHNAAGIISKCVSSWGLEKYEHCDGGTPSHHTELAPFFKGNSLKH